VEVGETLGVDTRVLVDAGDGALVAVDVVAVDVGIGDVVGVHAPAIGGIATIVSRTTRRLLVRIFFMGTWIKTPRPRTI
jgi:hypothetical protein